MISVKPNSKSIFKRHVSTRRAVQSPVVGPKLCPHYPHEARQRCEALLVYRDPSDDAMSNEPTLDTKLPPLIEMCNAFESTRQRESRGKGETVDSFTNLELRMSCECRFHCVVQGEAWLIPLEFRTALP